MLSDDEKRRLTEEVERAVEKYGDALTAEVVAALGKLESYDALSVNRALMALSPKLRKLAQESLQPILKAAQRDLEGAATVNAITELDAAENAVGASTAREGVIIGAAAAHANAAAQSAAPAVTAIVYNMAQSSVDAYVAACAEARVGVNLVGEDAMARAVQKLSEKGVTAYSYFRKDGTKVDVPADVGIRRAVVNAGKARRNQHVLDIAREAGRDLIEVSSTVNCRETHEAIDGKVFSLSGTNPDYEAWSLDLEELLSEPNCGHQVAIYDETVGGSRFNDPLEGTGYSLEEARALTTAQRKLENDVRKAKRVERDQRALADAARSPEEAAAALERARKARAKVNAKQAQIRKLVEDNKPVLARQRHRETLYDSAQRMKKRRK